jgi:hypothetical protein
MSPNRPNSSPNSLQKKSPKSIKFTKIRTNSNVKFNPNSKSTKKIFKDSKNKKKNSKNKKTVNYAWKNTNNANSTSIKLSSGTNSDKKCLKRKDKRLAS